MKNKKVFEPYGAKFRGPVRVSLNGRDLGTISGPDARDQDLPQCLSCWRPVTWIDPDGVCMTCGVAS